ncbi:aminotransferase class V-fold PLP-dependent enzyme, partial [Dehalococcoidia bacterium]|nr:aminotransferase class V-fold PLP-dependent enzyme [Dehalococcoidia bacterium]
SLFNGHPTEKLPNTLSVSFRGLEADTLLSKLNRIAISAGAACHSDRIEISSVLQAMSIPLDYAMGTLRISTGRYTTASEIDIAIDDITEAVNNEYKVKVSKA